MTCLSSGLACNQIQQAAEVAEVLSLVQQGPEFVFLERLFISMRFSDKAKPTLLA